MRLREQRLWDRMRANRPLDVRLERVENGVGEGMPDVLSIHMGRVRWVELKSVEAAPARASTPVLGRERLNVAQRNWHLSWAQFGGRTFVLVGVGRQQFLVLGMEHDAVNGFTMEQLERVAIGRTWPEIFNKLRE